MQISIVVAIDQQNAIGSHGKLPWNLPRDMQRFKQLTTGKWIIMGRKTYESIGHPLPNRTNVVVTTQSGFTAPGCIIAHSFTEAILLGPNEEVMVIGGAQIFRMALSITNRIYLTRIEHSFTECDSFFPKIKPNKWVQTYEEIYPPDEKNIYLIRFCLFERK